jgi:hypothetical protein
MLSFFDRWSVEVPHEFNPLHLLLKLVFKILLPLFFQFKSPVLDSVSSRVALVVLGVRVLDPTGVVLSDLPPCVLGGGENDWVVGLILSGAHSVGAEGLGRGLELLRRIRVLSSAEMLGHMALVEQVLSLEALVLFFLSCWSDATTLVDLTQGKGS